MSRQLLQTPRQEIMLTYVEMVAVKMDGNEPFEAIVSR